MSTMPLILFAGFNRERQPVLTRWQRASRELGERARWAVGLIEIDDQVAGDIGRIAFTPGFSQVKIPGENQETV